MFFGSWNCNAFRRRARRFFDLWKTCFLCMIKNKKRAGPREPGEADFSICWPSAISELIFENICFIEVKRNISEWLLSGGVFGWEVQSVNVNFARRFHRLLTCVSLRELSGIPFCPDSRSHTAAATGRISASMQKRSIRIAVQICVFWFIEYAIIAVLGDAMLCYVMLCYTFTC